MLHHLVELAGWGLTLEGMAELVLDGMVPQREGKWVAGQMGAQEQEGIVVQVLIVDAVYSEVATTAIVKVRHQLLVNLVRLERQGFLAQQGLQEALSQDISFRVDQAEMVPLEETAAVAVVAVAVVDASRMVPTKPEVAVAVAVLLEEVELAELVDSEGEALS
jgi:hypothetical protein